MIHLHKTGRYWNWLRTPAGDPARAILEVWIEDLNNGTVVVNVLPLLLALQNHDFAMNDQSNFLRWLRRSYGRTLINNAVATQS